MPELVIDADGHVLEPPDVWQRYVDPTYRGRAIRVRRGDDGRDVLEVDGRPARLTTAEMLGGFGGMGKPMEELAQACLAGRYAESAPAAAVEWRKRRRLVRLAQHYLKWKRLGEVSCRFDVLTVTVRDDGTTDLRHIRAAFDATGAV